MRDLHLEQVCLKKNTPTEFYGTFATFKDAFLIKQNLKNQHFGVSSRCKCSWQKKMTKKLEMDIQLYETIFSWPKRHTTANKSCFSWFGGRMGGTEHQMCTWARFPPSRPTIYHLKYQHTPGTMQTDRLILHATITTLTVLKCPDIDVQPSFNACCISLRSGLMVSTWKICQYSILFPRYKLWPTLELANYS